MALKKQVITMPFMKGVDEHPGEAVVPLGDLTQAENVSFDKAGELIKRGSFRKEANGIAFSGSPFGATLSDANFGAAYEDNVLVSGEKRLWSRTSSGLTDRYSDAGVFIPCEQTNTFLNRDGAYKHGPAKAGYVFNSGTPAYTVVAYTEVKAHLLNTYFVVGEVRDTATQSLIHREVIDSYSVDTGADGLYDTPDPHVCVLGSKAFIIFNDAGTLMYSGIALTTPVAAETSLSFSTPASLSFSVAATRPIWDCDVATSAGNATVAGHTSGKNTAGCIVLAGLVANSSTGDGDIRVGYYTNAVAAGTVTLVAVTGGTGTTTYAGTSTTGGSNQAVPDKATNSAITGAVNITALNEATPANGQLLITSTYYDSGASASEMEFHILDDNLAASTKMVASTTGIAMRSTAWRESDSLIRVAVEYAKYPATAGSKASFRPNAHQIISFEMNRSGSTQTSLANVKYVGYNCSLFTDSFTYGSERYICVSYTCGNRNSLSGNLFTLKAPPTGSTTEEWTPIAAGGTGENPTNFTSDHQSGVESSIHLFGSVSRVTEVTTGKFQFGANRFSGLKNFSTSASVDITEEIHNVSVVEVNFKPSRTFKSLETPNGLLLTGGFLHHYDGSGLHENNFFVFPVIECGGGPGRISATAGTGGWSGEWGDYRYRVVYEWYDEMGNVHRSAPSDSVLVTIPSNSYKSVLPIYVPQFTRKTTGRSDSGITGVHAVVYRTEKNGSLYFRIGSVTLSGSAASVTVNFEDFGADGNITNHEILYATAGIPTNTFVGSCKDLALHKERAFVTTSENAIMFSKTMGSRDGINFTDGAFVSVGSEKLPINATESGGEAFFIFTDTDGYYIAGDGPDNTGVGRFTDPRRFAPGLGAVAASDHIYTAGGSFIHTDRGLIRVLPNLQLDYAGKAITDTLSSKAIHSMCLDEGENEARFFITDTASGSTNSILVYNTLYGQFTVHKVAYSSTNYGVGAFYMGGDLYRVTADGEVHKYTPKTYTDNCTGSDVTYDMVVRTGFINVAGLQNMQRLYRVMVLGKYLSAHDLTIEIFNDYNNSTGTAALYQTETESISSDPDPYNYRVHLKNQKSRSIRCKITAGGSSATGETLILRGLALEVGVRAGTFKLPAAQTLG